MDMLVFVQHAGVGPGAQKSPTSISRPSTASSSRPSTASSSGSRRRIITEQEHIWESDIYPPEAWEGAAYQHEPKFKIPPRGHRPRPSVDAGDEVWESDLYTPDAWVFGVEKHDHNASQTELSASNQRPRTAEGSQRPKTAETHEEVFWPNIEAYISRPTGSKPIVSCVICRISQLVVKGLQVRNTKLTQEEREVLPCGHVVGADCWKEWEAVAAAPVKCPVCNAVVD